MTGALPRKLLIDERGAVGGGVGFGDEGVAGASRSELEAIDAVGIDRNAADGGVIE